MLCNQKLCWTKLLFPCSYYEENPFLRLRCMSNRRNENKRKADDRELKTRITTAYRRPVKPHGASHVLCLSPYHLFLAPMLTVWGSARQFRCLAHCPAWTGACVACAHNATFPRASDNAPGWRATMRLSNDAVALPIYARD